MKAQRTEASRRRSTGKCGQICGESRASRWNLATEATIWYWRRYLLIKVFHDGLLQETLADSYMINANLGDIFNFLISPNWKCGSPALPGSC